MLRRRSLAALGSALALVFVAVGCGGGGGGETTASVSKAEFIKEAKAVCKREKKKLDADFVSFSNEKNDNPTPSKAEWEELVNEVVAPSLHRLVAELRALGAPEGDEERVEAMLAAFGEGLEKVEASPEGVLSASAEIFEKATKLATAYGLSVCAGIY